MLRSFLAVLVMVSSSFFPVAFAGTESGAVQFELQAQFDKMLEKYQHAQEEIARLEHQLRTRPQQSNDGLQQLNFAADADGEICLTNFQSQSPGGGGGAGGGGGGDVATQSQNPVGGLWMMWLQNDMKLLEGPLGGKRIFNTTVFQPVMPVQLTDTWKVINRPVFMFNNFEVPGGFALEPPNSFPPAPLADPFSTEGGLGDIAFIQWFSNSPADSKMVTGLGWNWMFPAASKDSLGTGRTSVGPSAVAMYLGDKVITGAIMQQYFSIEDDNANRARVSLMDLQYVFRYRLNPMFSIGFAPNMQWDQVSGIVTMPVGLGFDTMTMAGGKMPIRWGAELQYFASHEDRLGLDPEWNFRLYVSPIIKAPEWATKGLFGGGSKCCKCNRCRCGKCR